MLDEIKTFLENLWPITIVDQNEQGVFLRFGKFKQVVEPGWYLTIPFIDKIIVTNITEQSITIPPVSIITNDEKKLIVGAIVFYNVENIWKRLLSVEDVDRELTNFTSAKISEIVSSYVFDPANKEEVEEQVYSFIDKKAESWGLAITEFKFTNYCPHMAIHIFGEKNAACICE